MHGEGRYRRPVISGKDDDQHADRTQPSDVQLASVQSVSWVECPMGICLEMAIEGIGYVGVERCFLGGGWHVDWRLHWADVGVPRD